MMLLILFATTILALPEPGNRKNLVFEEVGDGWCRPDKCDVKKKGCRVNGYYGYQSDPYLCEQSCLEDDKCLGYAISNNDYSYPDKCHVYTKNTAVPSDMKPYPQKYTDIAKSNGEKNVKCFVAAVHMTIATRGTAMGWWSDGTWRGYHYQGSRQNDAWCERQGYPFGFKGHWKGGNIVDIERGANDPDNHFPGCDPEFRCCIRVFTCGQRAPNSRFAYPGYKQVMSLGKRFADFGQPEEVQEGYSQKKYCGQRALEKGAWGFRTAAKDCFIIMEDPRPHYSVVDEFDWRQNDWGEKSTARQSLVFGRCESPKCLKCDCEWYSNGMGHTEGRDYNNCMPIGPKGQCKNFCKTCDGKSGQKYLRPSQVRAQCDNVNDHLENYKEELAFIAEQEAKFSSFEFGLAAVGAAATMYGAWKCLRGNKEYQEVGNV